MTGTAERLRRGVKWILHRLVARGSRERYVAWRARAMQLLGRLGAYERAHVRFLGLVVGPGRVVVDAGAHFGIYTKALSALVGSEGRVLAFEPQRDVFDVLCRLRFPFANVECHRIALSDREGERTLSQPLLAGGAPEPALATLEPIAAPCATEVVVTRTLDSFGDALHGLAFVKIDVEDHEVALLDGARGILAREQPIVQVEDHDGGARLRAFLERGSAPGYRLQVLDSGALRDFDPEADGGRIDFYLVPARRAGSAAR